MSINHIEKLHTVHIVQYVSNCMASYYSGAITIYNYLGEKTV